MFSLPLCCLVGEEAASLAPRARGLAQAAGPGVHPLWSTPGTKMGREGRELQLSERVPSLHCFPSHTCIVSSSSPALSRVNFLAILPVAEKDPLQRLKGREWQEVGSCPAWIFFLRLSLGSLWVVSLPMGRRGRKRETQPLAWSQPHNDLMSPPASSSRPSCSQLQPLLASSCHLSSTPPNKQIDLQSHF